MPLPKSRRHNFFYNENNIVMKKCADFISEENRSISSREIFIKEGKDVGKK